MITYEVNDRLNQGITVFLDGKIVGTIKFVETGWQYFPKGSKTGGDIFPTLADVKQSLETDEQ